VADQDRIVYFENRSYAGNAWSVSYPDFVDYKSGARSIALVAQDDVAVNLTTGDRAERVYGALVSGDYFDVLGVKMAMGRAFTSDEDGVPDARPVVVVGHTLWQRRFQADPDIVNRTITLNGQAYTVIGVAPAEFIGSFGGLLTEVWVPIAMQPQISGGVSRLQERGNHWFSVLGRLAPAVSREQARAELNVIATQLGAAYPNTNRGNTIRLYPMWQSPGGAAKVLGPVLMVLGAVVALVLLIACANVANLLLGRALDRRREVAIRLSLGATRGRLVRQLLTEGLILAAAGGLAGAALARWSAGLLMTFLPPVDVPLRLPLAVDGRVLLFTFAVTALTAILFGLVPALQGSRADVATALKEEPGTSSGNRRKAKLRGALVVAQVALSVVLLVGAGLFVQSLRNAQHADTGFNTTNVLLAGLDLFPSGYTPDTGLQFYGRLLERTSALPGVRAASLARRVPINLGGRSQYGVVVEGYQAAPDEDMSIEYNNVSPDYFRTLDIALVRGRDFTPADRGATGQVLIVNETMARRFWPGQNPIGRRVRVDDEWLSVVGVARDITYHQLVEAPQACMYLPLLSAYRPDTVLHVRTSGDPTAVAGSVRDVVKSIDPQLVLYDVKPMSVHLRLGVFVQRIAGILLGLFSLLALVLATVGLFGVVSYLAGQRRHEMGVRMALGARPSDVLALVVRHGLGLAGLGLALGVVAAAGFTRLVAGQLHGISPTDPSTFLAVGTFILAVAALASYGPARRASRLDPVRTLRHQ
jgi:predicted permease